MWSSHSCWCPWAAGRRGWRHKAPQPAEPPAVPRARAGHSLPVVARRRGCILHRAVYRRQTWSWTCNGPRSSLSRSWQRRRRRRRWVHRAGGPADRDLPCAVSILRDLDVRRLAPTCHPRRSSRVAKGSQGHQVPNTGALAHGTEPSSRQVPSLPSRAGGQVQAQGLPGIL